MEKFLYFAYGSNMDVEQMRFRCPDARAIATAELHNYKLTERQFADIDKCDGATVYGLLWVISKADAKALDRYEGRPTVYLRKKVTVVVRRKSGIKKLPALVYEMTPNAKKRRNGMSYSPYYRWECSRAAQLAGIPDEFAE